MIYFFIYVLSQPVNYLFQWPLKLGTYTFLENGSFLFRHTTSKNGNEHFYAV